MNSVPHLLDWLTLAIGLGAVVFGMGYRLGGQNEIRKRQEEKSSKESAHYFRGVHFLLTDEPDKAIEAFVQAVRINSETVEIYLSLGNLFRSRGEVGRAIRIHQNIIARPNLSSEIKTEALYALAEDYRQGGFVDRAVEAYRRVLQVSPNHVKALSGLQALHENEGRWDGALNVLKRLEKASGREEPQRRAHLRVKMSLEALHGRGDAVHSRDDEIEGDPGLAMEHLRAAIKAFPGCVEAYRLLGEQEMAQGRHKAAIKNYSALKKTRPSHFFLLVDALKRAYTEQDDEAGFEICMRDAVEAPSASPGLFVSWGQILAQQGDVEQALDVLRQGVKRHPGSAAIAHLLVDLLTLQNQPEEAVKSASACLEQLTSRQHNFQCTQCGFQSHDIYWKCPQCHHWDTMDPL